MNSLDIINKKTSTMSELSELYKAALNFPVIQSIKRDTVARFAKRLALPLSILSLVWVLFGRHKHKVSKKSLKIKKAIQDKEEANGKEVVYEYSLKNFVVPRLYGVSLKIFSRLYASAFGKHFMTDHLKKKSNINIFDNIHIPEKPTLFPIVRCASKAVDHNNGITEIDVWELIKPSEKTTSDFNFNSISDYVEAYRTGRCTPTEVAQRAIAAIAKCEEEMNPKMRIFVQTMADDVLNMAEASTERYKKNAPLSVFDGIPVSAKDEFRVAGYPCYEGTPFLGEVIETEETESALVSKLRKGGAVILGVTNMHQLGIGTSGCNASKLHGTARNPYNPNHFCGASSSGSGGAVAAGLGPVSLGVDGGGSTRIPAAACGVVGVKGTFGRFSCASAYELTDTVSHPGPLCTDVRDAAISYAFLAGPDPAYSPSLEQPPVTLKNFENVNLEGVKIGVDWTYLKDAEPEVVAACVEALKFLEHECNAEIVSISIPELEEARIAHFITIITEMIAYTTRIRAEFFYDLNYDTQIALTVGGQLSAEDYFKAQKQRTRSMNAFENIFKQVDCVITPSMPITMAKIEPGALKTGLLDSTLIGLTMRYMFLGNLIGIPCMSIPIEYGKNGLPIGLQVMANWWDEDMMFRVAHAAEGALKAKKQPMVYFDLL